MKHSFRRLPIYLFLLTALSAAAPGGCGPGGGGPGTVCSGTDATATQTCSFDRMPLYSQTNPNLAYVNRPDWLYELQPTQNPPDPDPYARSYLPLGPIPGDPGSLGYWLTAMCGPTSGTMVLMAQLNGRSDDVLVKGWTADAFVDGAAPADQPGAMPNPLIEDNHYSPALSTGAPLMSSTDVQRVINYTYMQKGWGGGGSMVDQTPKDFVHASSGLLAFFPDHAMTTRALSAISKDPEKLQALSKTLGVDTSRSALQQLVDIQSAASNLPGAADGGHGTTISRADLASKVSSGYGLVLAVNDYVAHVTKDSSGNSSVTLTGGGNYGHILALHSFTRDASGATQVEIFDPVYATRESYELRELDDGSDTRSGSTRKLTLPGGWSSVVTYFAAGKVVGRFPSDQGDPTQTFSANTSVNSAWDLVDGQVIYVIDNYDYYRVD
jgi:hypothetical protein